jgi:two-component system, response regulator YesN
MWGLKLFSHCPYTIIRRKAEMYKLLIVDDEELIRKGLISRIIHHGFDFDEVMEASNGREALELIRENMPHIVITDVRMPDIDGIQLIKCAKDLYPEIRVIIISGYAEFEYAEQALNMGVNGYLLKPIVDKDLVDTINRVIKEIDNRLIIEDINSKKETLEKYIENLTFEQKLNQIIHNVRTIDSNVSNDDFVNFIELDNSAKYVLALVNIDGKTYYQSPYKYQEIELIKANMVNVINNIDSRCKKIIINNYKDTNQIIIILMNGNTSILRHEADIFLPKALNSIMKVLMVSVTIGTSGIESSVSNELYRQAKEAFQQRLLYGNGEIYKYDNIQSSINLMIPKNEIRLLQKYIERCDIGNVEIILKNIFSDKNFNGVLEAYIRFVWMEIINILLKVGNDLHPDLLNNFDLNLLDVEVLDKFDDIDKIISYLYTLIIDFLKLDKVVDLNCKSKIKMTIQYIDQHFEEELTVNDLAYKYAMSPNYFSTVFKKEVGKTVINYITEIRIKNACKLLIDTKASVVDISNKVGYEDTQYFFRVFKKIIGKTPLEYRKRELL